MMTDSIEAAPQPSNFTATFTIQVKGIRTTTVNNLQNVIKQVEWVLVGEESGQRFELPQTTMLLAPVSETFIPLAEVTEANVAEWIEANETRMPGIKAHIQLVLDKQIAEANLTETPMPWAPIAEEPVSEQHNVIPSEPSTPPAPTNN